MLASDAGYLLGDIMSQRHLINIKPEFLTLTFDLKIGSLGDTVCPFAIRIDALSTLFNHKTMFCVYLSNNIANVKTKRIKLMTGNVVFTCYESSNKLVFDHVHVLLFLQLQFVCTCHDFPKASICSKR